MEKAKILVVEDDNIVAIDIQDVLKILGYDVSAVASSGEEAIKITEEIQPDLVLMDIVLERDTDGVEVTKQIRNRFDIPVIYLTAHADEDTIQRAKVTEAFGYILKPFKETELRTNIEMALYKHRIEKRLKERKRQLAAMLKSIGDAVIATDIDGLIIFMNPVAEVLTGWKQEEVLGKDLREVINIINEKTLTLTEDLVIKALQGGDAVGLSNHILITKGGREISIDDSAAPIKDDKGNITGVVLVFRNIIESGRAETEILKLQKERGNTLIGLMVVSSPLFLEPIRKILESEKGIEIVAEASTYLEINLFIEQKRPDVLLIDTALPDLDIAKIMQLVREKSTETKVLLLLHAPDEEAIMDTLLLGV